MIREIVIFHFNDSPAGKVAWAIWNKKTEEEKKKTGLMDIKHGSTVFVMPGMTLNIVPIGGFRIITLIFRGWAKIVKVFKKNVS